MTTVFTDGACSGNPGPGGWAWAVPGGRFASGAEARTTNQRMEIHAVLDAVVTIEGPIEIVSDSTYVVHCFRDRWWEGWLRKGWVNSAKKPVANRDLWEPLIDAYRADPRRLTFRWVKGHSGDAMNDLVDRLAVEAAQTQQGRRGDGPPEASSLGPADAVGQGPGVAAPTAPTAPVTDVRVPEGRRLVVIGHKPPELGGYDDNLLTAELRRRLTEVLAAKREVHAELVVLTGLGLGTEQLGAEAAAAAGVPYVAVLAFPDPDAVWPSHSKERFRSLLDGAEAVVVLQDASPATKQKAGAALARRDDWLFRHADEAIAVWDGQDRAVGMLVRSLHDRVGEDDVWVIAP
jgi:ribonuclease HI